MTKRQKRKSNEEKELVTGREETVKEKRNLRNLARDIIGSYDARVKIVGEIVEDTHRTMNDFRGKREELSKELRELLAKSESLRRKDFERMMVDIVLKQNEREEQVKKMLADFRREEETVADKMRNLLKKGEGIRIRDFKKMTAEIKQEQDRRTEETSASVTDELQNMRGEVYQMLDNFKKERQSVATAWHEIIGLFHPVKNPYSQVQQEMKTDRKGISNGVRQEKADVNPDSLTPEISAQNGADNAVQNRLHSPAVIASCPASLASELAGGQAGNGGQIKDGSDLQPVEDPLRSREDEASEACSEKRQDKSLAKLNQRYHSVRD